MTEQSWEQSVTHQLRSANAFSRLPPRRRATQWPGAPRREAVDDGGGAAASGFALTPTTATSRCTYIDLFSEYPSQDPRIPGGVPPPLGQSSVGCVLRGSVHGRPAAVKIIDLWKVDKDVVKREVRMYQLLQPLQGVYVPYLLAYGYLDGWQYFVATSLEGPPLSKEEGCAMSDADACEAALAALDAVHQHGVLHGSIDLRQFVLASQRDWGGGGGGGSGGNNSGGGGAGTGAGTGSQQQQRIMLLDFGRSKLVSEVAEETGEEPAVLFQRERRKLEELLGWELQLQGHAGAAAAVAVGGGGGETRIVDEASEGPAAARSSPPAALGTQRPPSAFPSPPPRLPYEPYGWRPRPHVLRNHLPPAARAAHNASRLPLHRIIM